MPSTTNEVHQTLYKTVHLLVLIEQVCTKNQKQNWDDAANIKTCGGNGHAVLMYSLVAVKDGGCIAIYPYARLKQIHRQNNNFGQRNQEKKVALIVLDQS